MGRAIAETFAKEGTSLILSDLHAEPLEALAEQLRAQVDVTIVAGDISAPDYPTSLLTALGERSIGALVHAAGVSPSMADGKRIFAINFTATQRIVEAALPQMARGSTVVLIASMAGQSIQGWPFDGFARGFVRNRPSLLAGLLLRHPGLAYALSKRAVQLYVPTMAPAFGHVGARIVSLSPGIIQTPMGEQERAAGPEMDKMLAVTPEGRMGESREIASVVAFLVSSGASYITGTDILVDGGTMAGVAQAGGMRKL